MKTSLIRLKIKLKSLAEESRIIRSEERKLNKKFKETARWDFEYSRDSLEFHRKLTVREESRLTHIAYGFLKGVDYSRIENPKTIKRPLSDSQLKYIFKMIERFNGRALEQEKNFYQWLEEKSSPELKEVVNQ